MEKFKSIFFHLSIIFLIACKPEGASAIVDVSPQAYYFNAISGSDTNDGLSPESPFQTLDQSPVVSVKKLLSLLALELVNNN